MPPASSSMKKDSFCEKPVTARDIDQHTDHRHHHRDLGPAQCPVIGDPAQKPQRVGQDGDRAAPEGCDLAQEKQNDDNRRGLQGCAPGHVQGDQDEDEIARRDEEMQVFENIAPDTVAGGEILGQFLLLRRVEIEFHGAQMHGDDQIGVEDEGGKYRRDDDLSIGDSGEADDQEGCEGPSPVE